MSGKNFGPSVSGYLDPTGRNWETTVFQSGKPVLDKELNLQQDVDEGFGQSALRRVLPSGWISDDFVESSDPTAALFTVEATANQIGMPSLLAHVNGWLINVVNTNNTGTNILTLSAPGAGAGTHRTDLVILEVWRLLLSAAPSTTGKSASGRIWKFGNVKTDPANDLTLNFADDIKDSTLGSESTKRVQIQYRLRVITGVDLFANPYGIDDSTCVANSVPTNPATPDGVATLFTYTNQSSNGDPGLWVAGDGNPSNTLGTVDGFMYAVPLLAVFRRNQTAFDRINNQNGAPLSPGPSPRADGLFSDMIVSRDIADLRLGVSPVGWSFQEVAEKNLTYLFDNALRTEWVQTVVPPVAFGMAGHTFLWSDEIGVSTANGGAAPNSGDAAGGPLIGQFDAARRRFTDRPIYEVITIAVPVPGGGWPNATITVDFTSLPIYPYSAFNWAAYAPAAVCAQDIVGAYFIGPSGEKTFNSINHISSVTNLGAIPVGPLSVTFDALTGEGLTNETLYLDVLVCYPTGSGLSHTPTNTYGSSSFSVNDPTRLPAGAPVSFSALANTLFDTAHRGVQIEYTTVNLTVTFAADTSAGTAASITAKSGSLVTVTGLNNMTPGSVGSSLTLGGAASGGNNGTFPIATYLSPTSVQVTNAGGVAPDANNGAITWDIVAATFRLYERANSIVSVLKNGVPIVGGTSISSDGRIITFTNSADYTVPGDNLAVTYTGLRPLPQNNEQLTIWYEARAPQTSRDPLLGNSLTVIPRWVSPQLYVITSGSASQDTGYPFPFAYVQTGGIYNTSLGPTYTGEHELSARAAISISDFNATTGFLKLPTFVPYMPDPELVTFNRSSPADIDAENRTFFKSVPSGYIPNAFGQDLSDPAKHKVVLPILAELSADSALGHRGQMVLLLILRWAVFDETNGVFFNADLTQNTTTAAVFRLKGNLLNKRAS